ncbi:DUF4407 domain-containing protein [Planktothrix pseudagardhii]|uniref:DUF4407 domain-containing protein n=1 Tax=Planktothrix pseudagardhii TaxID=132604 RepID=A0A9W4G307_9CYAN|nr:DUF4407 domain-containing protein [Planktothrix pseudagardhii]CAD5929823.1 hypothetical protein NO713_01212 [Planktothrix pseudagardhii]
MKTSIIQRILLWCAGVDIKLLENCNSDKERHKYSAIGLSILLTTACAVLSGGYAFYTIFKNPQYALMFGSFWGLLIFNMDRVIIITTHKESKISLQQMGMATVRILVGLLIAVVVAKPLEAKMFEKPIRAELMEQNAQIASEMNKKINQGMPEIDELQGENQRLENTIFEKTKNRDMLCDQAMKEADGISGTGKEGKGPVYQEKLQLCEQQKQELKALQDKTEPILEENRQRIRELKSQRDQQFQTVKASREDADDILTQLNVLKQLAKENQAIAHASHAISLLFIIIDTAPIFAKLMAKRGPYDARLEQVESEEILRADQDREYFPTQLKQEQDRERQFYQQTLDDAYNSPEMKQVKTELSEEIVKRTRKKLINQVNPFFLNI